MESIALLSKLLLSLYPQRYKKSPSYATKCDKNKPQRGNFKHERW